MTTQHTDTQADWKDTVEYAGFYVRMSAFGLDSLAVLLPLSFVFGLFYSLAWGEANFGDEQMLMLQQTGNDPQLMQQALAQMAEEGRFSRWIMENLIFSISSGALVIGLWHYFSSTPGKMLLGMKIVDADSGLPPSMKQNIIRYAGYFVSTAVLCLGMFWVGFDKRKQGWHDKMANTVVVYKKSLPHHLANIMHYTKKQKAT
jgi:uncharacterized RDD family membrane protein YckC